MVIAVVSWGLANILVKQMSIDGLNVAFYRLWLGTALTFALSPPSATGSRCASSGSPPRRSAFGVNMVLFFTALKVTTIANATLIGALQPAIVLVIAGPMFGERVGRSEIGWTVSPSPASESSSPAPANPSGTRSATAWR
jgi:drug/metabolite transporter (DMT)-like permease